MKKIFKTLIVFFVILIGFFTVCSVKVHAEDEVVEDNVEEVEEEQLGFFEKNWQSIVSALLGTTGGLGLCFGLLKLAIKRIDKIITENKKKAEENGTDLDSLNKMANLLKQTQNDLDIAYNKLNELTNKIQTDNEQLKTNLTNSINAFKSEIIANYGNEIILMSEHYKDIMKILDLIANNSEDIVKTGASRLISEMVEEAQKGVTNNGEQEELQE